MVIQKSLENLKQGPKETKVAVASGIAISVVAVLFIGWALLFFHKIQRGDQNLQLGGAAQNAFNFQVVKDAQQQLQNAYSNTADDFRQIRDAAADKNTPSPSNNTQETPSGADYFAQ